MGHETRRMNDSERQPSLWRQRVTVALKSLYKQIARRSEFKEEMTQVLNDLEENDESEIQMRRAILEFQQENRVSTTENKQKIIIFLIISLTIIPTFCLIILLEVYGASDRKTDDVQTVFVRNTTETLTENSTENLTELVEIPS